MTTISFAIDANSFQANDLLENDERRSVRNSVLDQFSIAIEPGPRPAEATILSARDIYGEGKHSLGQNRPRNASFPRRGLLFHLYPNRQPVVSPLYQQVEFLAPPAGD